MFFEQFALLCKQENTTPTEFVKEILHLSSSKVTAWKNGSIPKYEILNQIAGHFHVTVGALFDGNILQSSDFTQEEIQMISDFRTLNQEGKDYVRQQMTIAGIV